MPTTIQLSVILPAYNEEKVISSTLDSIFEYLRKQPYQSEVIVVANNCTDRTVEIVKEYQANYTSLRLVEFTEFVEGGTKGLAVMRGMLEARGKYRLFMDTDYAAKLEEVEKLWSGIEEGYEVVIGSRYMKDSIIPVPQKWYRIIASRLANLLVRIVLIPEIRDTQCGFKLFTERSAENIFSKVETTGWGMDLEILAIARRLSYRVKEVGIEWTERAPEHRGRYGLAGAYISSFRDLYNIKKRINRF